MSLRTERACGEWLGALQEFPGRNLLYRVGSTPLGCASGLSS
jgi:hypothetical protein